MLKRFLKDESGSLMIEYSLIAILVAMISIGVLTAIDFGIVNVLNRSTDVIDKSIHRIYGE